MTPAPADTARAIVDRVRCGDVRTPGEWYDVVYLAGGLPPKLKEWTFEEITLIIGDEAGEYLRAWSETVRAEVPV